MGFLYFIENTKEVKKKKKQTVSFNSLPLGVPTTAIICPLLLVVQPSTAELTLAIFPASDTCDPSFAINPTPLPQNQCSLVGADFAKVISCTPTAIKAEKHKDIACTDDPTSVVPVEILEIPMGTCKTFKVDVGGGTLVTGSYKLEGSCEEEEEDKEGLTL